tara:strand:- start:3509 stop:3886 length:378 start_codon:yes stop_codon:yes gene_type:complete
MNKPFNKEEIFVKDIGVWAHVGVLDRETLLGQKFLIDFSIWFDSSKCSRTDSLEDTFDYSLGVRKIQEVSIKINCKTIEYFSKCILKSLEDIYGQIPIEICIRKCTPPIEGFDGYVGIKQSRNFK